MNIDGNANQSQYKAAQMAEIKYQNRVNTSAAVTANNAGTTKEGTKTSKSVAYDDIGGRIANIPDLEQYEEVIQRFLSGESELESSGKPLTDDQIALRKLMREYRKTDMRTPSQIQMSMQKANSNFLKYWMSSGNTGPIPGRVTSADGSFRIFNSKAEKDEFMKESTMNLLKNIMSVISAKKA